MITETMTFKEVYREIETDHDNLERWWGHRQRDVERMARKQTRFPWCKWHEYLSPRRNRYLILTESPTRHYMKHGIYVVRTFITYEMATGRQQEEFTARRSRILTTQETEQLIRLRRWEMEQEIKRMTPDFL